VSQPAVNAPAKLIAPTAAVMTTTFMFTYGTPD
jgi:hypothetical protein